MIRAVPLVVIFALAAAPTRAEEVAPPIASAEQAEQGGARDTDRLPPPSIGLGELLGPLAKTMLMLAIVLAIAYLTLHKGLGRLVARQNLGKRVKVVERVALDPRRSLFLVEVDGKQMLLGSSDHGVVHLKDLSPPAPSLTSVPGEKAPGARFADALEEKKTA